MTDSATNPTAPSEVWACVALMGHVELWGRLSEEEKFGVKMGRIDIPKGDGDDEYVTQWFGGSAIYRITHTTEETAREMAGYRPRRIGTYSRPAPPPFHRHYGDDDDVPEAHEDFTDDERAQTDADAREDDRPDSVDRGTFDSEAIPREDDEVTNDNIPF